MTRPPYCLPAVLLGLLMLVAPAAPASAQGAFQQGGNGILSMEAEHASSTVAAAGRAWELIGDVQASNSQGIQALPDIGGAVKTNVAGNSPQADYEAQLISSGTQYLWFRARGEGYAANSFHYGVNGTVLGDVSVSPVGSSWVWVGGVPVTVASGATTLNVWMREDGTEIDKIVLVTDAGYQPSGTGPAESPRDGGGGGGNTAPAVNISSPADGATFTEGGTVGFAGTATDAEDGSLSGGLSWSSSRDGTLGSGSSLSTTTLTLGTHVITASVTDSGGHSGNDTITITIEAAGGGGETGAFQQGGNGILSMEAEHASSTSAAAGRAWEQISESEASNTQGIQALPDIGGAVKTNVEGNSPRADYQAHLIAGGTQYLWFRARGQGYAANSFHYGVNGTVQGDLSVSPVGSSWVWVGGAPVTVPSGTATVNVWMREDGTEIDKIVLVTDAGYQPSGTGPAESPRDGGGGGGNTAPAVNISSPADGATFTEGGTVGFAGTATDAEDGSLSGGLSWSSSRDGVLGSGGSFATNGLSVGAHVITAAVTDSGGLVGSDTVTISVEAVVGNAAPSVNISAPADGAAFTESASVSFAGTATDAEDGSLSGGLAWTSSRDGTLGSGSSLSTTTLTLGTHVITATVTDSGGLSGNDTVTITIEAAGGGGGTGAFQQGGNGILSMEAEHASSTSAAAGRAWEQISESEASNTQGIQALPDIGGAVKTNVEGNSPRADYQAQLIAGGTQYLWFRARGQGYAANSFHYGVNGSVLGDVSVSPVGSAWVWVGGVPVTVASGATTLNVWMREDGTEIDKIVLVTDAGYRPSGSGPAESPRDGGGGGFAPIIDDFSDGDASDWATVNEGDGTAIWQVVGNAFRQSGQTEGLDEGYHLGTYAYLPATLAYSDYRFEVDIEALAGSGEDVGVLFRYSDPQNYYRLMINARKGTSRLERRESGVFTTLASNQRGYMPGQSLNVAVEAEGHRLQAYLDGDPLFAAVDAGPAAGGVGLYARDFASFDNVSVTANSGAPAIVIASPTAHSVTPGGAQFLSVAAVARNVPAGGTVQFLSDGAACGSVNEPQPGLYTVQCRASQPLQPGDHSITARLLDAGLAVASDINTAIGIGDPLVGAHLWEIIGDSITEGFNDEYAADNLGLVDQRSLSIAGWGPVLADLLTQTSVTAPSLVINEGYPGDTTADALNLRLAAILERNPLTDRAIVMLGTNDARQSVNLPSGAGCSGASCDNTYKGNLIAITDTLRGAGRDTVYLPLLPPVFGNSVSSTPYSNPFVGVRSENVQAYNDVIRNELSQRPGLTLGPDLFACFLGTSYNRFSLFEDNLHPNGLGSAIIAQAMHRVISGAQPAGTCSFDIYIVEDVTPYAYKQNWLETGDRVYIDEAYALSAFPAMFAGGVWITPRNADVTSTSATFLSFDVGTASVTVYVAYDGAGQPPVSASHTFQSWTPPSPLLVEGGQVGSYSLVRATGVTGVVRLGGSRSAGPGARQSYLVIIVPN